MITRLVRQVIAPGGWAAGGDPLSAAVGSPRVPLPADDEATVRVPRPWPRAMSRAVIGRPRDGSIQPP
jgi:hypothetical protein